MNQTPIWNKEGQGGYTAGWILVPSIIRASGKNSTHLVSINVRKLLGLRPVEFNPEHPDSTWFNSEAKNHPGANCAICGEEESVWYTSLTLDEVQSLIVWASSAHSTVS